MAISACSAASTGAEFAAGANTACQTTMPAPTPISRHVAGNEALVTEALARLRAGRTTLVIGHRLATVWDADWIVVPDWGRAVEQGTHAALLAANRVYAALVRMQAFAATPAKPV